MGTLTILREHEDKHMKGMLQTIPIEQAVEGMVTGRDVLSPAGYPYIIQGTSLSSAIIDSLIRKGIRAVSVVSIREGKFSEDEIQAMEYICREEVSSRFAGEPSSPLMQAIYKAALRIEAIERLEYERGG